MDTKELRELVANQQRLSGDLPWTYDSGCLAGRNAESPVADGLLESDGVFIAAAVNALPALLDELDCLRALAECGTCHGTSVGDDCYCRGEHTAQAEARGEHEYAREEEAAAEAAEADNDRLRAALRRMLHETPCTDCRAISDEALLHGYYAAPCEACITAARAALEGSPAPTPSRRIDRLRALLKDVEHQRQEAHSHMVELMRQLEAARPLIEAARRWRDSQRATWAIAPSTTRGIDHRTDGYDALLDAARRLP